MIDHRPSHKFVQDREKTITLLEQFLNQIGNHRNRGKINTPNTPIHNISPSWLCTGTSI